MLVRILPNALTINLTRCKSLSDKLIGIGSDGKEKKPVIVNNYGSVKLDKENSF